MSLAPDVVAQLAHLGDLGRAPAKPGAVFLATMSSEHYAWHGLGATPRHALEALAAAWDAAVGGQALMSGAQALVDYGAWVFELAPGDGACDGSVAASVGPAQPIPRGKKGRTIR